MVCRVFLRFAMWGFCVIGGWALRMILLGLWDWFTALFCWFRRWFFVSVGGWP